MKILSGHYHCSMLEGVIGKVKYMQGRSALVMRHTGKSTKTGTPSKQRITFGFGIPIPRPLSYKDLMQNISQIDIGELISVRDTLCATLPQEQRSRNNAPHSKQILS